MLCFFFLASDESNDELDDSQQWIHSVNRGGLINVSDSFYQFLVAVELELRKALPDPKSDPGHIPENLKVIGNNIQRNEDVLFFWEAISINWCPSSSDYLLKAIVKHYITVRGFSFTKAFMEHYKQSTKKTTQKSKALRKTLQ